MKEFLCVNVWLFIGGGTVIFWFIIFLAVIYITKM